jgi:hypothetical protein
MAFILSKIGVTSPSNYRLKIGTSIPHLIGLQERTPLRGPNTVLQETVQRRHMCPICPVMNLDDLHTEFKMSGLDPFIMCNNLPAPYRHVFCASSCTLFSGSFLLSTEPGIAGVFGLSPSGKSNLSSRLCRRTGWVNFAHPIAAFLSILQPTYSVNSPTSSQSKCCNKPCFA